MNGFVKSVDNPAGATTARERAEVTGAGSTIDRRPVPPRISPLYVPTSRDLLAKNAARPHRPQTWWRPRNGTCHRMRLDQTTRARRLLLADERNGVSHEIVKFEVNDGIALVGDLWLPDHVVPPRGSIVMLHGGGQTRHSWRVSSALFARAGWKVLAYDARGHGDSDWDPTGDYRFDAMVSDLSRACALVGGDPVVVGASMGGIVAMLTAGEAPGFARALVLVDITPRVEESGAARIRDFMEASPDGFADLQEVSDAIHGYNPHRPRPASLDGLRKNVRLHANDRWYWHWDPQFLTQSDEGMSVAHVERLAQAAGAITVPTLLVRGKHSDVVSEAGVQEMKALIPQAQVESADAGHMIAGDDNDVFATHVVEFLDNLG